MSRLSRWFFRAPILLYRLGLGWLLGRRFLMIVHRGRKSGLMRETVLEVVDVIGDDPVIVSGFGRRTDWLANILADPSVNVSWGRRRFAAEALPLGPSEATAVFERYRRDHKVAAKALGGVVGVSLVDDIAGAVEMLPALVLKRRPQGLGPVQLPG